jgi:hypothetical protein
MGYLHKESIVMKILMMLLPIVISLNSCDVTNSKEGSNPVAEKSYILKVKDASDDIFFYDFENLSKSVTEKELCDYLDYFSQKGSTCYFNSKFEIVPTKERGNVLRVYQPEQTPADMYLFKIQTGLLNPQDELITSYWLNFSDNFDLGKGGKLPGGIFSIVKDKPYPAGGNKVVGDSGFSNRTMFYTRGFSGIEQDSKKFPSLYSYIYHDRMKTNFGDRGAYTWQGEELDIIRKKGGNADSKSEKTGAFRTGYLITTRVKMNSINRRDGLIETYINGIKVYENKNISISSSNKNKLNRASFSFFFGGDTSWAPKSPQPDAFIEIDDLTLKTKSIEYVKTYAPYQHSQTR